MNNEQVKTNNYMEGDDDVVCGSRRSGSGGDTGETGSLGTKADRKTDPSSDGTKKQNPLAKPFEDHQRRVRRFREREEFHEAEWQRRLKRNVGREQLRLDKQFRCPGILWKETGKEQKVSDETETKQQFEKDSKAFEKTKAEAVKTLSLLTGISEQAYFDLKSYINLSKYL